MFSEVAVLTNKTGSRSKTYTYHNNGFQTFIGQLVKVPFGDKNFFGIVTQVSSTTNLPYAKDILQTYGNYPLVPPKQLNFLKHLSDYYYGSLSDIIKLSLPSIALRQLPALERIKTISNPGPAELILIPSENRIPEIISSQKTSDVTIVDNRANSTTKFLNYLKILSGQTSTIVSTRSGILLPHPNFKKITIYDEEDVAYQEERAPYYNSVKAAEIFCRLNPKTQLKLISASPSLTSFYLRRKNLVIKSQSRPENLSIVSLKNGIDYTSGSGFLAQITLDRLKSQILSSKPTLIFLNRISPKGFLHCQSCSLSMLLASPTEDCPNCHSPRIRFFSPNLSTLHTQLIKLLPKTKISLLTSQAAPDFTAEIFLATKSAIYTTFPEKFGLLIIINTDDLFYPFNFNSEVSGFQTLKKLIRIPSHSYILQSKNPDNPLLDDLLKPSPQDFLIKQLKLRQTFKLPPFTHCFYIQLQGKNLKLLKNKAKKITKLIKNLKNNFALGEITISRKKNSERLSITIPIFHPDHKSFDIITAQLPATNTTTKLNYNDTL